MRFRSFVTAIALVAVLVLAVTVTHHAPSLRAQGSVPVALSGAVRSTEEGAMEGVLVRARRAGSNKTVTVVTDAKGAYAFPRDRLEPGRYEVSIRAIKYVLPQAATA